MYDAINKLKEARQSFRSNYEIILTFFAIMAKIHGLNQNH